MPEKCPMGHDVPDPDAEFCPECGVPLPGTTFAAPAIEQQPLSPAVKQQNILFVVGIVVVLGACLGSCVLGLIAVSLLQTASL